LSSPINEGDILGTIGVFGRPIDK